jgi:hypothetical protein
MRNAKTNPGGISAAQAKHCHPEEGVLCPDEGPMQFAEATKQWVPHLSRLLRKVGIRNA